MCVDRAFWSGCWHFSPHRWPHPLGRYFPQIYRNFSGIKISAEICRLSLSLFSVLDFFPSRFWVFLRNRRWGGCVYVLQMFFRFFLFFFVFFPSVKKYQTTVLGNGWTYFHETFTKRQRAQCSSQRRTEMEARPPINFWGAKNYTLRTWWWRLASESELVCWLWHCAATAVALKRHERVNVFNLVSV